MLGRVCYHYCEEACVIGKRGEAIAIRHLKRAALDYGRTDVTYTPGTPTGKKIAMVGGGPAGLMAARIVRHQGHDVTVFEQKGILGGLATLTIPPYRLSRDVWQQDVRRLETLGIEFKHDVRFGRDITLDDLREKFDAVLLAIGTQKPTRLDIPGTELEGVHVALVLLEKAVAGDAIPIGEGVAVIGGGDVAIDSARMAFRLGSAATDGVPSALLDFDVARSDDIDVRIDREGNLMTFGGPDVNWVTRCYSGLAAIQTRIDSSGLPFVYVTTSGNEYSMVNDYFQALPVTDYSYDTMLTDAGRQVRIIVGISGFATRDVSDLLASGLVSRGGNHGIVVQPIDNEGDGFYEAYGIADTAL